MIAVSKVDRRPLYYYKLADVGMQFDGSEM